MASIAALTRHIGTHQQGVVDIDFAAEVELEVLLGRGAFGAVYRGRWRRAGGRAVAVKMLHNVGGAEELAAFQSEVAVLSRLAHPCIVRFLGACLAPPHACMLEELVEGGSLHSFLHGCVHSTVGHALTLLLHRCTTHLTRTLLRRPAGRRFTYLELLSLADDIASAMEYLHPTVVHRCVTLV